MKKIGWYFIALIAMLACFNLTSCTTTQQFGVVYDLNITGDGDGKFDVTFPNGEFGMDGKAGLGFVLSNDTAKYLLNSSNVLTSEEIMASNDPKKLAALQNTNAWVDQNFKATTAGGSYDILIKGSVKETLTGFIIAIEKRLTNRE